MDYVSLQGDRFIQSCEYFVPLNWTRVMSCAHNRARNMKQEFIVFWKVHEMNCAIFHVCSVTALV